MFPSILTLKHPQGRWGSAARVLLLSQTFLRLQNKLQVRFLDWLIHTTERRPVNISTCWLTVGRQRLGTQTPDDVSAQPPCSLFKQSADRKYLIVYPLDGGNIHVVGGGAHIFILLVGEDVDANQVNLKGRWGIDKCLNKENRSHWKQHNSNWSTCQCHASHQPGVKLQ